MARNPAKQNTASAAKPDDTKHQNTQGAEDSLDGAQAPDQAQAPQQPSDTTQDGTAGGNEPPATTPGPTPSVETPPTAEPETGAIAAAQGGHPDAPGPDLDRVVTVRGPQNGRRRIGRRFGADPVEIPLDHLTPEDLLALVSDPALIVSIPGFDPKTLAAALRPSA